VEKIFIVGYRVYRLQHLKVDSDSALNIDVE
jgi:hypothetical protein